MNQYVADILTIVLWPAAIIFGAIIIRRAIYAGMAEGKRKWHGQ